MAPNSPPDLAGPRRTKSGRVLSFKDQSKLQPEEIKEPEMFKQHVPAYDLDWQPIKAFLERRFPAMQGQLPKDLAIKDDKYHFRLPELLTDGDRAEIQKLKKSKVPAAVKREFTPD